VSALRDALLAAADVIDADPVSDTALCEAIAACREAGALMGQELMTRTRDMSERERDAARLVIRRLIVEASQALLAKITAEVTRTPS
jgi:hypothetical protein